MDISIICGTVTMESVETNKIPAGSTPARRRGAAPAPARRESALRLVRDERRRLERPRPGRFDYLKRTYD